MLTPSQMDDAGGELAAVYRQIEAELLDYLVRRMIEGDVSDAKSQAAIVLLTQDMPLELQRAIDAHAAEIDAAIRRDVQSALLASDAYDLAIIAEYLGMELAADALSAQARAVAASVKGVIARDNLELSAAARTKFLQWSTWAATQAATGATTPAHALHKAVRELARGGLSITSVTYHDEATGEVTVTNHADVAVQRHIRTIIAQGAAELTMERMREAGIEFVEVSSHIGARPSHAEWHGRVYHVGGAVELDGTRYEDFHEGTGYGGIAGPYTDLGDRLLGVNCRHHFGPWVPGMPHAYGPDPEHPSGLPNDEVYKLTQKQRQRERDIRATKRELAAAQRSYDADPSIENQVEVTKLKAKLRNQQERMREFIDEANAKGAPGTEVLKRQPQREWAGDMPKARNDVPAPANRTLDEFMAMPSTQRAYKAAGLTKAQARDKMRAWLSGRDMPTRDFAKLTRAQQQAARGEAFRELSAGLRGSPNKPLTTAQQVDILEQAAQIGIPPDKIAFRTGTTAYSDELDVVFVGGNVYPDLSSTNNRDTISVKATLAHEYYGHRRFRKTKLPYGDWRDEFRASYRAALDTPNLTDEERRSLMVDAYNRASEGGAALRYTDDYRRIVYGYEKR